MKCALGKQLRQSVINYTKCFRYHIAKIIFGLLLTTFEAGAVAKNWIKPKIKLWLKFLNTWCDIIYISFKLNLTKSPIISIITLQSISLFVKVLPVKTNNHLNQNKVLALTVSSHMNFMKCCHKKLSSHKPPIFRLLFILHVSQYLPSLACSLYCPPNMMSCQKRGGCQKCCDIKTCALGKTWSSKKERGKKISKFKWFFRKRLKVFRATLIISLVTLKRASFASGAVRACDSLSLCTLLSD